MKETYGTFYDIEKFLNFIFTIKLSDLIPTLTYVLIEKFCPLFVCLTCCIVTEVRKGVLTTSADLGNIMDRFKHHMESYTREITDLQNKIEVKAQHNVKEFLLVLKAVFHFEEPGQNLVIGSQYIVIIV